MAASPYPSIISEWQTSEQNDLALNDVKLQIDAAETPQAVVTKT